MKLRSLFSVAAVAVLFVGGQQSAAQQMAPYGPGPAGAYQGGAQMGYPSPYGPAALPQFDVRQAAMANAGQQPMGVGCNDCGNCGGATCNSCCGINPCWCHCVAVWGEFLYLQARNTDVAYAVPIDGPIVPPPTNNPVQVGRIGLVDQEYDPGFRFGFAFVMGGCQSISLQYTHFESSRFDQLDTSAPNVLRSLVSHPGTLSASQDFLSAQAVQDINFDFVDIDYRQILDCSPRGEVTVLGGFRFGQVDQDFSSEFQFTGTESVLSEIDFYGAGLRLGLEGERYSRSRRWLAYGKAAANLMFGEFNADYRQSQSFDTQVVDTTWKAERIVPMLDLELGAGWQSRCGTWRLTGGYMVSAWYNMVKTDEWINSVQNNNFVDMSSSMSFDGVVLRCEGRF